MFFIGFTITSYPYIFHATSIRYTKLHVHVKPIKFLILYTDNIILPIKMLGLQKMLPFESYTTQTTSTQVPIQGMLNSPQNGRCSFIFHHPTCFYVPYLQSFSLIQPFFTCLFYVPTCSVKHPNNLCPYLPLHLSHPTNSGCVKYSMSKGVLQGERH